MEEVEIFLNPEKGDTLQDIVCPPPSSKRTEAQRRWHLIRNMALAQYKMNRLTSLTETEKHLLETLEANESLPEDALCAARRSLRSSIITKQGNLSKSEVEFLHKLIAAPKISTEQLKQAEQVLMKDPLYAMQHPEIERRDQREARRQQEAQRDASFRKELWQHCGSEPTLHKSLEGSFQYKFQGKKHAEQEDDDPLIYTILGTCAHDLDCQPHVLSPPMMDAMRPHMPFSVQQDNFWLKYSLTRDGSSMISLLQRIRGSARTIVAIETLEGDVLGAFTSSPWRPAGNNFYGTGEAFLWRLKKSRYTSCPSIEDQVELESDVEFFAWSGKNRNVQRLVNHESELMLGGGGEDGSDDQKEDAFGAGLMVAPDLSHGFSYPCQTFGSPSLPPSAEDRFDIANMEVWTLTPVESLDQAEKVELGRHFVFDHGNFISA